MWASPDRKRRWHMSQEPLTLFQLCMFDVKIEIDWYDKKRWKDEAPHRFLKHIELFSVGLFIRALSVPLPAQLDMIWESCLCRASITWMLIVERCSKERDLCDIQGGPSFHTRCPRFPRHIQWSSLGLAVFIPQGPSMLSATRTHFHLSC